MAALYASPQKRDQFHANSYFNTRMNVADDVGVTDDKISSFFDRPSTFDSLNGMLRKE